MLAYIGNHCFQPKIFRPNNVISPLHKNTCFRPDLSRPICLGGSFLPHFDASQPLIFYSVSAAIVPQTNRPLHNCVRIEYSFTHPSNNHEFSIIGWQICCFWGIVNQQWWQIGIQNSCWAREGAYRGKPGHKAKEEDQISNSCLGQEEEEACRKRHQPQQRTATRSVPLHSAQKNCFWLWKHWWRLAQMQSTVMTRR